MKISSKRKPNFNRLKFCNITYSPLLRYKLSTKAMKEKRLRKQKRHSKLNEFTRVLESIDKTTPQTTDVVLDVATIKHTQSHKYSSQSNPYKKSKSFKSTKNDDLSCLYADSKSESEIAITLPSVIKMPNIRTICKPELFEYDFEDNLKFLHLNKSKFNTLDSLIPTGVEESNCNRKNNLSSNVFINPNEKLIEPVDCNGSDPNMDSLVKIKTLNDGCVTVKSSVDTTVAKLFELSNSSCLVVLKPENPLYFVGVFEIELLKGSVDVLGYHLTKLRNPHWVFSLQGSSHLNLKSTSTQNEIGASKLTLEMLVSVGVTEITAKKVIKESDNTTVFVMRKHKLHYSYTVWPFIFQSHIPFPIFPQRELFEQDSRPCHTIEEKLDCLIETSLQNINLREFNEVLEWKPLQESIISSDRLKVVLCGGKGLGKSTLLRYLVNRSLSKHQKVLVIDFDLGQCEFTVPGCISVVLVEEPLLGPNYSHLKEPLRSVFLGEVDVTKCPESYIEGSKSLIDFAVDKFSDVPWLINTMGFTRGFGVKLNCGLIQYLQPTHVVQIESKDKKLNFPSNLYPEFVSSEDVGSFKTSKELFYKLHIVPSGAESPRQGIRGMSPLESRNLVILSYLSKMLSAENLLLSKITPYMVPMDQVELRTTDGSNRSQQDVAACLNGNLVALCNLEENKNQPNCRGFGIVRGIDWQTSTLYLITPLSLGALSRIDCLVKGNVAVPESLYYQQADWCRGHVPYLARTSGRPTTRFARREFRPLPAVKEKKPTVVA